MFPKHTAAAHADYNTVFLLTDHNNVQQCVESSASFTEDHNNYKTARMKERKKEREKGP
jgi:hypothetical protein